MLKKKRISHFFRSLVYTSQEGSTEGLVLVGIVLFSIIIGGGIFFNNILRTAPPGSPLAICCDTGNGAQCMPQTGTNQVINFTSPTSLNPTGIQPYGLLKSNSHIFDCFKHAKKTNTYIKYPDGNNYQIILNNSQDLAECHDSQGNVLHHVDQIANIVNGTPFCEPIPDDAYIYVCKANCNVTPYTACDPGLPQSAFFGDRTTLYDIYMRLSDYPTPGVDPVIKNCSALTPTPPSQPTPTPAGNMQNSHLLFTPYPSHETLQLHTFDFGQISAGSDFPRPFCKPALYFYPPTPQHISVTLHPKGKINYSDPLYTQDGWQFTGNPDGSIDYNNKLYDYLYYEAAIPDALIPQQDAGYVVASSDLTHFFTTILPELGLNNKEQQEFIDYWIAALPKSPYFQISIIPQNVLNTLSPLAITPLPDTLIRVTLNFKPLDTPISLTPPIISAVKRQGFTVVEWAGMYKADKKHPFTCLQ